MYNRTNKEKKSIWRHTRSGTSYKYTNPCEQNMAYERRCRLNNELNMRRGKNLALREFKTLSAQYINNGINTLSLKVYY